MWVTASLYMGLFGFSLLSNPWTGSDKITYRFFLMNKLSYRFQYEQGGTFICRLSEFWQID